MTIERRREQHSQVFLELCYQVTGSTRRLTSIDVQTGERIGLVTIHDPTRRITHTVRLWPHRRYWWRVPVNLSADTLEPARRGSPGAGARWVGLLVTVATLSMGQRWGP